MWWRLEKCIRLNLRRMVMSRLSLPPRVVFIIDGKTPHGGLSDRLRGLFSIYYYCKQCENKKKFMLGMIKMTCAFIIRYIILLTKAKALRIPILKIILYYWINRQSFTESKRELILNNENHLIIAKKLKNNYDHPYTTSIPSVVFSLVSNANVGASIDDKLINEDEN